MDIAYASLNYESDYYLEYVFKETTRALQKTLKEVYLPKDSRLLSKSIAKLSDKELLAAKDAEPILIERVDRKGMELNARGAAGQSDPLADTVRVEKVQNVLDGVDILCVLVADFELRNVLELLFDGNREIHDVQRVRA